MNGNFASARHRDGNNYGPSVIRSFGSTTGGKLRIWPNKEYESEYADLSPNDPHRLLMFDGRQFHQTLPYEGDRRSLVFFTNMRTITMDEEVRSRLELLGFRTPETPAELESWEKKFKRRAETKPTLP